MYKYAFVSRNFSRLKTYSFALISHTVVYDNVEDGSSVCKYNKYTKTLRYYWLSKNNGN